MLTFNNVGFHNQVAEYDGEIFWLIVGVTDATPTAEKFVLTYDSGVSGPTYGSLSSKTALTDILQVPFTATKVIVLKKTSIFQLIVAPTFNRGASEAGKLVL